MRTTTRLGFTLIELLAVIAIVAILAGILFPVLARAKTAAKKTVAISNLRQCGLAILMYADENGGLSELPTGPQAEAMLASAPTCDPNDYWRSDCRQPFRSPLIGSYAYVRNAPPFNEREAWTSLLESGEHTGGTTLMMSLFYSSTHPLAKDGFGFVYTNPHPDRLVVLKQDGAVRTVPMHEDYLQSYTWARLFQ